MTPEHRNIPDWARRERQADLGWMRIDCIRAENLDVFSAIASVAFENTRRGAIVVDTTSQAMPGVGHPFGYFFQEQIEELGDEDTNCMVTEYEPAQEFVVVLLNLKTAPASTGWAPLRGSPRKPWQAKTHRTTRASLRQNRSSGRLTWRH
jgi:hypothetical protein